MAACRLWLLQCFGSFLLEHLFERVPSMANVLSKQVAGILDITLPAQIEDPMMLFVGALHPMGQVQLQPGITLSAIVDVTNDRQEARLMGAGVKNGVELPVESSPGGNMIFPAQFTYVFAQDSVRLRQIFFRQVEDREFQDFRFEKSPNRKQFFDIGRRERRNNRASIGHDRDQAFGFQLTERLTNRDAADLVLVRNGVLAKLRALGNLSADDLIAQFVGYGRGKRLAWDRGVRCRLQVHLETGDCRLPRLLD